MKITRNVVEDLLPAYFSGEASADTCTLVEEYFGQHPGFETDARKAALALQTIGDAAPMPADQSSERAALKRAKRVLLKQKIMLAFASTLTMNAVSLGFSFEIGPGVFRVHWLAISGQAVVVGLLIVVSTVLWAIYFRIDRRIRTRILG